MHDPLNTVKHMDRQHYIDSLKASIAAEPIALIRDGLQAAYDRYCADHDTATEASPAE